MRVEFAVKSTAEEDDWHMGLGLMFSADTPSSTKFEAKGRTEQGGLWLRAGASRTIIFYAIAPADQEGDVCGNLQISDGYTPSRVYVQDRKCVPAIPIYYSQR